MLKITVLKKNSELIGVSSEGHAEYDDPGKDIVCAAVSVLMLNTVNSIEAFTEDAFDGEQADGYLSFQIDGEVSDGSRLLLKSLVLGLESIEETYGSTYIEIVTKEV